MAGISKNTFWNWLHSLGLTQKRGSMPSKPGSPAPLRFEKMPGIQCLTAVYRMPQYSVLPGG
jgi:hypothetical protein